MILKSTKEIFHKDKLLLPVLLLVIFTLVAITVYLYKEKLHYFYLFVGIGTMAASCEWLSAIFPEQKQTIRRTAQCTVAAGLFLGLSLYVGVNFQFAELVFDGFAGIATGATIQLLIARIILPLFVGNAFCSKACWNGAVFEFFQKTPHPLLKTEKHRTLTTALAYLFTVVVIASVAALYHAPKLHESELRFWIIGENLFIFAIGLGLSGYWGSRAYCRLFCPLITISGFIAKFSVYKIKPVNADKCHACGTCNNACPMMIDVRSYVQAAKRVNHSSCIQCEHCVSSCTQQCLRLTPDYPWK